MRSRLLLLPCAALLTLAPACDKEGDGSNPPKVNKKVKCEPPFKYEGRRIEAEAKAGKYGGNVDTYLEQVREVDESVERYTARYMSLCNDYRNGAVGQEQYARESEKLRDGFQRLEELWVQLEASNDPEQFGAALTQMQQAATLSGGNADLQLSVGVYTQLPGQSGYGVSSQGATLSTGSKLYLQVQSSAHAYLYLYQVNHAGKLTVLFPDPQIKITNPLPAGQSVRIPHGSLTYDVNDKDLGVENLHIVASAQPLGDLASAAQQDQGAERVASNDLDCGTRGLELKAPPTCTKTRGLVLSDQGRSASAGASPSSVRAKAEANDDAVHVVYSFHHVGDHATYGKKNGRGIEMLTGDAAKANRDRDIDSCPGEGEVKHMEVYGGGIERWCVDLNPQGALVDHGPYRKWHPNGKLWVTGQHEWGQRTGTWETFDEQGNATASTSY